jgi:hypothetical protein
MPQKICDLCIEIPFLYPHAGKISSLSYAGYGFCSTVTELNVADTENSICISSKKVVHSGEKSGILKVIPFYDEKTNQ